MTEDTVVASKGGSNKPRKPRASAPIPQGVYKRMDDVEKKVDQVSQQQGINQMTLQRVESKMDAILMLVGSEEEDGEGGFKGVGLLGRMRRVEESQSTLLSKYKTWIAWGGGFVTALSAAVAIVWWLISDKLEVVLKGTSGS